MTPKPPAWNPFSQPGETDPEMPGNQPALEGDPITDEDDDAEDASSLQALLQRIHELKDPDTIVEHPPLDDEFNADQPTEGSDL